MNILEKDLESLIIGNDEFRALEDKLKVFCPFEAVGVVRQEIRHGAFLSNILEASRPHGFGGECLRALMAAATRASKGITLDVAPLDAHLMRYDDATAHPWRNIDILVQLPSEKFVIAIELKIDAREHSGQLGRYRKQVQEKWPEPEWRHLFLFLTKRGDDPSEEDGEGWCAVELEALTDELDRVVKRRSGTDASREMLSAYVGMLRRRHLSDERLEKIARNLWLQHREALEFLAERQPNAMSEAIEIVASRKLEIAELLSKKSKLKVICDENSASVLQFAVPAWDVIPGFLSAENWTSSKRLILAELISKPEKARAWLKLGRGDQGARTKLHSALVTGEAPVYQPAKLAPQWKRLKSATLFEVKGENEQDPETTANKIQEKFIDFMGTTLEDFDVAFKKAGSYEI